MTKRFSKIYFPVTVDILTPGHIKAIRWLEKECEHLIIGVLTDEALKGYKKNVVSFDDRFFIVQQLTFTVVAQRSLSPEENIKLYKPDAIASGDGWEKTELEVIERLGIEKIDIPLPKQWSSTKVKNTILKENQL